MQSAFRYWRPFVSSSIPSSSRLVPGPGASPVFRWRRSGVHVSCGGPGGGGEGRHQQPVGAGQSVSGPVDAMVSAELHPQPHLHLLPPDRLWRISDGQGGGATVTARPRSREYRLHPYRWGYTGVFIALHLYLTHTYLLHPLSCPSVLIQNFYSLPDSPFSAFTLPFLPSLVTSLKRKDRWRWRLQRLSICWCLGSLPFLCTYDSGWLHLNVI